MYKIDFSEDKHQEEALKVMLGHKFTLLYGGARSGKTFIIIFLIFLRALKHKSRHAILRFRFSHLERSVIRDTFPKVAEMLGVKYKLNQARWYATLPNGSEIWFGGLDDKERVENILGNEYATIFLNEASQISYSAYLTVLTRLAQKTGLKSTRMIIDENPPSKSHWTYKLFFENIEPEDKVLLKNPEQYGHIQLNPMNNTRHIDTDYLELLKQYPKAKRKRFLLGEFADIIQGAYFSERTLNKYRVISPPELKKVIVSVDPGISSDETSDETGIVVIGKGFDGRGYLLEDCSGIYNPRDWAKEACRLYEKWDARYIVAEKNQGGEMVKHTIQTVSENIPVNPVWATIGKTLRAEPISALYDEGKISHVGGFSDAENEMVTYTGAKGEKSPNRLDAIVHGFTDLFPVGVVSDSEQFNRDNLTYFDDYDFEGSTNITYIKISSNNGRVGFNYNFLTLFIKIKDQKIFVTDCLFNEMLPSVNIPSIIKKISENSCKKIFLECSPSFSAFSIELKHAIKQQIWAIKEFNKEDNRIISETGFIKNYFVFKKSPEGYYRDFMRQLNAYTNISEENELYAPAILASISYIAKKAYKQHFNVKNLSDVNK